MLCSKIPLKIFAPRALGLPRQKPTVCPAACCFLSTPCRIIKEEVRDTHEQACRMSALNTLAYVATLTSDLRPSEGFFQPDINMDLKSLVQ